MADGGFRTLHDNATLNFMLNRMAGDVRGETLARIAAEATDLDSFIAAALAAGEAAAAAGEVTESGTCFRGAEFYMPPDHPRKHEAYDRYLAGFAAACPEAEERRRTVPWQGGELGVIDVPATGSAKDVIVGCSGFDGLIEEMYPSVLPLAAAGYRVVLYEGPGQGSALRRSHLTMCHDWERPVAAVLDHLDIDSCTLLGVSLGGYLAPRAAAFEARAQRLIAWGPMYNFFECFGRRTPADAFAALTQLVDDGAADLVNEIMQGAMAADATARWSMTHGMHTSGGATPYDFMKWARQMTLEGVSDRIVQDTLILGASEDHLVPVEQLWTQAAALNSARSVTARLFTKHEGGEQHCQVGRADLAVGEILAWLERTT